MPEKNKYNKRIEEIVIDSIRRDHDNGERVIGDERDDFNDFLGVFDLEGDAPTEEWMSNVRLTEFTSEILTQLAADAVKEFRRRDFVEMYYEDTEESNLASGEAKKELINRTLNQHHLNHYQKDVRAKVYKYVGGKSFYRCWWERKSIKSVEMQGGELTVDEEGNLVETPIQPVEKETVIYDRFNYDIIDYKNIRYSPEYTYSLNQKRYVIIDYKTNVIEMEENAEFMGYINLDVIREKTEDDKKARKVSDSDSPQVPFNTAPVKELTVFERYGKDWVILKKDEFGNVIDIEPGFDEQFNLKKDAKHLSIIQGYVVIDQEKILCRYQLNPFVNAYGESYIPIERELCYIHPKKDGGFGDGLLSANMQKALDDTYNTSNDRTNLAMMPMMISRANDYTTYGDTFVFKPQGVILAYDPQNVREFKITDDTSGSMEKMGMLRSMQQQGVAIYPNTMGSMPEFSSIKATALAISENRTDMRTQFKALTGEYTGRIRFYEMICHMTYQFALPETAKKLMGDKVFDYDPYASHTFKPVSESIETQYSKDAKINTYQTLLQMVAPLELPGRVKVINKVMTRIHMLLGDEFEEAIQGLFEGEAPQQGAGQGAEQSGQLQGGVPTNQTGIQQTPTEQNIRAQI